MAVLFLAFCILFVYWQLVVAEGVYLGPRVVWVLYDWAAPRYNAIKCFGASDETWFLGAPLARALREVSSPLVLDVACGTGRLHKTLLGQPDFSGKVIGLDASRGMLGQAASTLNDHVTLIWQRAERLPFEDNTFDAVTCLEALEFMPSAPHALAEMARVLRLGGLLLTTNRIGLQARLMPGHTMSKAAFEQLLADLGFERIRTQPWQVEYDLVWAIRSGEGPGGSAPVLSNILVCPHCGEQLNRISDAWHCGMCGRTYPVASDGVIEMMKH